MSVIDVMPGPMRRMVPVWVLGAKLPDCNSERTAQEFCSRPVSFQQGAEATVQVKVTLGPSRTRVFAGIVTVLLIVCAPAIARTSTIPPFPFKAPMAALICSSAVAPEKLSAFWMLPGLPGGWVAVRALGKGELSQQHDGGQETGYGRPCNQDSGLA